MKILKIKIKLIEGSNNSLIYYYPVDLQTNKINILIYNHKVTIENTTKYLFCLALAPDDFSTDLPKEIITEVSKEEANCLGQEWHPPMMKIINEKLVDDIITRLKNGIPLTWMEIKALDPRDAEVAGINYSDEFDINVYF